MQRSEREITVLITGGAGQIAYSLIPILCNGEVFGKQTRIKLHLLDIPKAAEALQGVAMEIQDSCFPCLSQLVATTDIPEAFNGVDVAVLLGGFPRSQGMERRELIEKNVQIMKDHGKALDQYASRDCKVVVVANPANTNCLVCMKYAPSLPARNFTCLTRLDHERVRGLLTAELSKILGRRLSNTAVRNVMVLGNHSRTLVPYLEKVEVELEDGSRHRLQDVVPPSTDFSELIATVKNRGAQIIALRKLSSALSAAQAVGRHLRYWLADPSVHTPIDDFMSMGVLSNGNNYGIPEGLMFSMPCVRSPEAPCGYTLADGLTIPPEIVAETIAELQEERAEAQAIVGDLSIHNSRL